MSRHDRTRFVEFDRRRCEACGGCVGACPRQVLGMVAFLGHRHAHVDHAEDCRGCGVCAAACPHGAVRRIDNGVVHSEAALTNGHPGRR